MDAGRQWRLRASQPETPQKPLQSWKLPQQTFQLQGPNLARQRLMPEKRGRGRPQKAPTHGCPQKSFRLCSLPLLCRLLSLGGRDAYG